jgi:hypothetical protein
MSGPEEVHFRGELPGPSEPESDKSLPKTFRLARK